MPFAQQDAKKRGTESIFDNPQTINWQAFLKRPIFALDPCDCSCLFAGKTVLITGAAGSIGGALALSMMGGLAKRLVLVDRSEQSMKQLYRKYQKRNLTLPTVEFVQANILCQEMMKQIFFENRPDIIFHAAAMKHLPELESKPLTALENNVLGTIRLFQLADYFQTECFVNVSSDKAVNPTSILGVSKRLTELFLLAIEAPLPRNISLRLGNVLDSSGSVVPQLFQAIRARQLLPITDPLASRYFLTEEETTAILMHSSQVPETALLLPEMGGQRRIVELAAFLLNAVANESEAMPMNFIGLRDGEKCCEQLTYNYEYLQSTKTPGLNKICGNRISDPERFADTLGRLLELVIHNERKGLLHYLLDLVPEFLPSPTLLRHLK